MRIRSEDDLFSDDFTPVAEPVVERPSPERTRGRGDPSRGRVRGRGSGNAAPPRTSSGPNAPPKPTQQPDQVPTQHDAAPPETAPAGPKKEAISSVRGDRQATGGVRKPKLTEAELAEKMAQIQIKNATLTAAHERAEADAASFAEREQQAKVLATQRQKEERRDRQQMMGERERNRMRKLKAMEGREWDAEKKDEDFGRGGRSDMKGGFAGDKEDYTDGREYLYKEPRGGGGRGRGGGRGATRAEHAAPKQEDFPALPVSSNPDATSQRTTDAAVKSWADQVESSNPP